MIFTCGGAIIHQQWILTARHCLSESLTTKYSVRAGSSYHAADGKMHEVDQAIPHGSIALLKLSEHLKFNNKIKALALPSGIYSNPAVKDLPKENSLVTVSGWMHMKMDEGKHKLHVALVPIFNKEICNLMCTDADYDPLTSEEICVGYENSRYNTCAGDSGGPLVYGYTLIGVETLGQKCIQGLPTLYTEIKGYYAHWIRKVTDILDY